MTLGRVEQEYGWDEVLGVITTRRDTHHNKTVRELSGALLEAAEDSGSWVARAIESGRLSNVYPSAHQGALCLEKIVVGKLTGEYWREMLRVNSGVWNGKLQVPEVAHSQVVSEIEEAQDDGFRDVVSAVCVEEGLEEVGMPITTHRPVRYRAVFSRVVEPIYNTANKDGPEVILDAGASGGGGAQEAKECFPGVLRSYLGLDLESREDIVVRSLTASVRLDEIVGGSYESEVTKVIFPPREYQPIRGDMMDLASIEVDESVDLVIFNFSLYQTEKPDQALSEAGRVAKSGGLVVATDSFRSNDELLIELPGRGVRPSTWSWVKGLDGQLLGPYCCYGWRDNDFIVGEEREGLNWVMEEYCALSERLWPIEKGERLLELVAA
jgi:SAM-dependent methyltransferase